VNLVIRADVPADADVALRLWREADAAVSTTDDADAVRTLLARDPHALLIAEVDGEAEATLVAGWDGWGANLYRWRSCRHGVGAGSLARWSRRRRRACECSAPVGRRPW
jgi:hypothetical protein